MFADASTKAFVDYFANTNPFLDYRVIGPAPADRDLSGIHRAPFERLVQLARQAQSAGRGLGCLLRGSAGAGKSHLLARLARWADEGNAYFIGLHQLQAAPADLPRALLHGAITQLTGGRRDRFHPTVLYQLVRGGLIEAAGGAGHYRWRHLERALHRWLDEEGAAAGDRLIYDALFLFFRSATATMRGKEDGSVAGLVVRWLSGGALDPVEARLALLPPGPRRDDPVVMPDGSPIVQALAAIAHLARVHHRPLILALDQVDALDRTAFAALARFVEALLDAAPNLLVLTAGGPEALNRCQDPEVVSASARDRIAQFEVALPPLSGDGAEQLLRGRLAVVLAPFLFCEDLARHFHPAALFPLGGRWARRQLFSRSEVVPREVLRLARERWQDQQEALSRLGPAAWLEGWPGDPPEAPTLPPLVPHAEEEAVCTDTVPARRAQDTSHSEVLPEHAEAET